MLSSIALQPAEVKQSEEVQHNLEILQHQNLET